MELAFGLMIADLLVLGIGTGLVQIAVVGILAMAAIFLGGGSLLVNRVGISALLVVVLQSSDAVFEPGRFLDALVGGAAALTVNCLFPIDPERLIEWAAGPVFDELVAVLEDVAEAAGRASEIGRRRTREEHYAT